MRNIGQDYQIPDGLWKKIEALLPPLKPKKKSEGPGRMIKKFRDIGQGDGL
jgi:hypothetical protein